MSKKIKSRTEVDKNLGLKLGEEIKKKQQQQIH